MLTQTEADALIAMVKRFVGASAVSLHSGVDESYELMSNDNRERFLLDVWRGTFRLSKIKLQERARKAIVLVRLDIGGSPHTNPDQTRIEGNHLHLYREGYEDKWAILLPPIFLSNANNMEETFRRFCDYCHITDVPPFQGAIL